MLTPLISAPLEVTRKFSPLTFLTSSQPADMTACEYMIIYACTKTAKDQRILDSL